MDELISRVATAAGIDADKAREAIAIILKFLNSAGDEQHMQQIFDALPGSSELVAAKEAEGKSGGLLGGLAGMMGGSMGNGMGAMAALNELTSAGLDMNEVQTVAKELVAAAKEKAGDETVDAVVGKIPGLSQIL
ncbi:hypothetical protein JM93_00899 [Roseibium hamelinense]|uniref:DUF2267 domain-containing protein n=1 Tax=Roseibium hamelinense TaxID=150831 RepID=A0A562TIT1_9HYPH|nr:DUF2267 domain-containing protein [Roseibium hamelinense]MTI42598.1 DUF2267 domain-containing protein [Roseibium hamelinense]TWI93343.1 hypothetical protein JM93_00899 [Roseibium hamelinense]